MHVKDKHLSGFLNLISKKSVVFTIAWRIKEIWSSMLHQGREATSPCVQSQARPNQAGCCLWPEPHGHWPSSSTSITNIVNIYHVLICKIEKQIRIKTMFLICDLRNMLYQSHVYIVRICCLQLTTYWICIQKISAKVRLINWYFRTNLTNKFKTKGKFKIFFLQWAGQNMISSVTASNGI